MCLMKTCCCGCSLRQGAIGTLIFDAIILVLQFIMAIILTAILEVADGITQEDLDVFKVLIWIIVITPALRTFSGCASVCSNFKRHIRLVHFMCRVIADAVDVIMTIVGFAYVFRVMNLIFFLILLALGIYLDWCLYAFYKQEDQDGPKSLSQPPQQNVVVIQGQPGAGYPV